MNRDKDRWLQLRAAKLKPNHIMKIKPIETKSMKLGLNRLSPINKIQSKDQRPLRLSISFDQPAFKQGESSYNKTKSGFNIVRKNEYPNTLNLLSSNVIGQMFSEKKRKSTIQIVNIIRSNIKLKKKNVKQNEKQ